MTLIHTKSRVKPDGTVVVPVGASEAGKDVIVTVESMSPSLTEEQWKAEMIATAGSISDPTFVAPPDAPPRPAPDFDK